MQLRAAFMRQVCTPFYGMMTRVFLHPRTAVNINLSKIGVTYMRSKLLVLLSVLALVLGTFSGALAQDAPQVFCGDLAAEDCTILQESKAAMQEVVQYTATSSFDAILVGIPGLPADPTEVSVSVNGLFAMDEAAVAAAQALSGLTQEERLQLVQDSPETVVELFAGWEFDMAMGVAMTPELAAAVAMQVGHEVPDTLAIAAKLVDGVLYWDVSEVAAIVPTVASGWVGFPLAELLLTLADQGAFDQLTTLTDPAVLADSGSAGALVTALGAVQMVQSNPEMFEQFLAIERGEDVDLAGQTGATFVTTFDAVSFFGSPELQEIVVALAQAGAFEGTGIAAADIEQNAQMLTMMAPMLFDGITAVAQQTIGLDDLYQYDYVSELSWDLAGLIQMAAASGQLPAELQPTSDDVGVALGTIISNADLATEASAEIEAPADAAMIPLESLMSASTAP